uniref:low-density lipoprotein receptor class A domain-containing protein 2 n=1 Tax=Panthera onca TaxID=9690 RepID=UPI00295557E0|nr:low-density lipoprotein receptor class A domain-containing protein 2 [Panthera onca]
MEACLPQLPQRLLLLGAAALAASALETADLVDLCGQTWQGDGLLLRSHAASRRFYFVAPDTDCGLWMRAAAPGDRIRFQFRFFLVYSLAAAPRAPPGPPASNASSPEPADPCAPGSYLQFYEGPPGAPRALGAPLCGLTIPAPVASSGPTSFFPGLMPVGYLEPRPPCNGDSINVSRRHRPCDRAPVSHETPTRALSCSKLPRSLTAGLHIPLSHGLPQGPHLLPPLLAPGSCGAYFRCRTGRCIPWSLVCDRWGVDNCGDGSDQASWPPADCRGPSLVPSQARVTDGHTSQPLTPSPALRSAGPLQMAAERSPLAGRALEEGDTAAPPGGMQLLVPT